LASSVAGAGVVTALTDARGGSGEDAGAVACGTDCVADGVTTVRSGTGAAAGGSEAAGGGDVTLAEGATRSAGVSVAGDVDARTSEPFE
jgi:hypothetical protein